MNRQDLAKQAIAAGQAAEHNLMIIARDPERMTHPKKLVDGITYLNTMIDFAHAEIENARRPGRTSLKEKIKRLSLIILSPSSPEINGHTL